MVMATYGLATTGAVAGLVGTKEARLLVPLPRSQ